MTRHHYMMIMIASNAYSQGCSDCDITNDVNRWRLNGGMGDDDMDEDDATPILLPNGV